MTLNLIAVIGPIEPVLLAEWTRHYRALGIEWFHIAFHFPDHVPQARRQALLAASHESGVTPAHVSTGPWHEHTNTQLRDMLREHAGPGWHLLADSDEFQQYPAQLPEVLAASEAAGRTVVGGLLLDRVAEHGRLTWRPGADLDHAFPLGGHLTSRLLKGDARKVVLARSEVHVASGNHRAPGHMPDPELLSCVHHFKWRPAVLEDLRRRVAMFSSGTWHEHTPAMRNEAARLLRHVEQHEGRINIDDPSLAFRRVTLGHMPEGWVVESRTINASWSTGRRGS